jgi:hypothetical protein
MALIKFTAEIEKTSRILSTDWTDAAKILVERVAYSFQSGIKAFMGTGRFARREEIQQAQEQFGQQFGGVMSTKAATEMAGTARMLNVMPQQYIAALRPLSGILGGVDKAGKRLESTSGKFMKEGLTGKDAMQFMSENSNLIARNGGRFADSLTRAAIEAKKAGYSLQSIEGFGDRIVGDFEGFLEDATAMAAMGMQFDVSSLAEAAVLGDTERLKNELQSQLQAQGLSLENMNRAQRMQLEKTVGMPLEEALKIQKATETAADVTTQLDMDAAKMQSQAANMFRAGVAAFEVAVKLFMFTMGASTLSRALGRAGIGGIRNTITIPTGRIGTAFGRAGGAVRTAGSAIGSGVGAGLGLGIAGSLFSMGGDKLKAEGYEKTGAAADIAGKAASFGGVGLMFGPIAGAVGALVGTIYGIITNWEAVKKMFSSAVGGIVTAFGAIVNAGKWVGEKLYAIGTLLWENNPLVQAVKAGKNFLFGNSSQVSTAASAKATSTTPVVAAVNRTTNEMQSDTRTVANTRTSAPVINLPDNATLQQQVTELIRQVAVSNQKLDALATQTITVNMDGQKVGNIIKRSAMVASTGASTARSNG